MSTNVQPLAPFERVPPVRTMRPLYVDRLPPCNDACPAGENVQAWLGAAQAGRYRDAWEIIVRDNPMPAVHGRVCYHPCEESCNRAEVDQPVSIHAVERFLGDLALAEGWTIAPNAPTGKRVLVVGAGPSGLSAAWHLARRGHAVVIYEAGPLAGGMMHFGIPKYRLPRAGTGWRNRPHRGDGRADRPQPQGRGPDGGESRGRLRRRVPRGGRSSQQAAGHPGARRRQDLRRAAVPSGRRGPARTHHASGGAWPFTGAATPPWTPHARRSALEPTRR